MAAVSTAAFMLSLVVAMSMAYPVYEEKITDQDLVKAIMYLWNEETGRHHHAEAINRWNDHEEGEKDQESLYCWNQKIVKDNDSDGYIDVMNFFNEENRGGDRNDNGDASEAEEKDDYGWKSKERDDKRVTEAMNV